EELKEARGTKAGAVTRTEFDRLEAVDQLREIGAGRAPGQMIAELVVIVIAQACGEEEIVAEMRDPLGVDAGVAAALIEEVGERGFAFDVAADEQALAWHELDRAGGFAVPAIAVEARTAGERRTGERRAVFVVGAVLFEIGELGVGGDALAVPGAVTGELAGELLGVEHRVR